MPMYGHGQDGLTDRALTDRLGDILTALGDDTRPEDALVFDRPDFGRSAGIVPFGEIDAIIGTTRGVYLIEARGNGSADGAKPVLEVQRAPLRRHEVFRWMLARWRELRPAAWDDFRSRARSDFEQAFHGFTLAGPESGIALNLEFVLGKLAGCGERIEDVLLFTSIDDDRDCPPWGRLTPFRTIKLKFDGADRSGFYIFAPPPQQPITNETDQT